MPQFVKVAKLAQVPEGSVIAVQAGRRKVALCNVGGRLFAVDDTCTHEDASLSEGKLEGAELECPQHAARFDVRTGEVLCAPAFADLQTYPVRIAGNDIEVEV